VDWFLSRDFRIILFDRVEKEVGGCNRFVVCVCVCVCVVVIAWSLGILVDCRGSELERWS